MKRIRKFTAALCAGTMLFTSMAGAPTASAADAEAVSDLLAMSVEEMDELMPMNTSMFMDTNGYVYPNCIYSEAYLYGSGTITIKMILQRYQTSDGTWRYYNTGDAGVTYSNVSSASHTYYCSMPSGYSYRCKYIMTATVNGESGTLIGFSSPVYK